MALSKVIIDSTLATSLGTQAYHIIERLHDAGFDAWWVGGAVREMILEKIPSDIDIATDALPDQVASIFPKTDKTSATLGSVRVPLKNHLFEVTTFREDDEASDGRHPESVVFGKREDDAKRRDITINALYWNPISRALYDPFDGAKDLAERLIRFIGDPAIRIRHDALRILRVVRFRARLSGQYHPETYQALRELAPLLEHLSGTRKLEELEKMLAKAFRSLRITIMKEMCGNTCLRSCDPIAKKMESMSAWQRCSMTSAKQRHFLSKTAFGSITMQRFRRNSRLPPWDDCKCKRSNGRRSCGSFNII